MYLRFVIKIYFDWLFLFKNLTENRYKKKSEEQNKKRDIEISISYRYDPKKVNMVIFKKKMKL